MEKFEDHFPTYKETLIEIRKQLKNRNNILFKRIILISWPIIVLVFFYELLSSLINFNIFDNLKIPMAFIYFAIFFYFFTIIYYYIVSVLVAIEKRIWLDSYFDKKNLNSKESWNLALKLFFPVLKIAFIVFFRYLLLPILSYPLYLYFFYYLSGFDLMKSSSIMTGYVIVSPMIVLFIIFLYFYYLKVHKLKFLWFVFLDNYNKNFSYTNLFKENNRLNKIDSKKMEGRSFVYFLAEEIAKFIGYTLSSGTGYMRPFFEETTRQITSFSRIIAYHILYRYARNKIYLKPDKVNENLYKLIKK